MSDLYEIPFFSVVVPCYNQAQYLSECLQSVLGQTYQNWECIIVNDGSPDNTEEIAREWVRKDSRFKYLNKENGGVSDARNAGITIAKGEWILPLDADDKIGKDYLKLAYEQINQDIDIGLIYCEARFLGEIDYDWVLPDYDYNRMLFSNHIFCSAFFRKSDWILIGGYDINMKLGFEDWEFWINLLTNINRKVIKLEYTGFFYRRKKQSRDTIANENKKRILEIQNYIFEKHKKVYLSVFGSFQEILYQKAVIQGELSFYKKQSLKIHNNIITRILFKVIKLLV